MTTVFTQIINRELPALIIYEDDDVIVFTPKSKFVNPGHILVIPKVEVDHIFDLEDAIYHRLWTVAKALSEPLKTLTEAKRIGIVVEGFSVPHVHIHLCPLYAQSEVDPHRDVRWPVEERKQFVSTMIELVPALIP